MTKVYVKLLTCPSCGREFLCKGNENCFMFKKNRCRCAKCYDNGLEDCEELSITINKPVKVVFT